MLGLLLIVEIDRCASRSGGPRTVGVGPGSQLIWWLGHGRYDIEAVYLLAGCALHPLLVWL